MTVSRDGEIFRLILNQDAPEHSCRPAVEVLFRFVARTFGPHALAVIMTGMGSDGTLGSKAIHQASGGSDCRGSGVVGGVGGMPGSVVGAALADHIYSLSTMAGEIARRVNTRRPGSAHASTTRSNAQSKAPEIRPAR
jgi:two-component system chemotaxis response regulator CheB